MKILTTVASLLLTATIGIAQNHFWTLPNQYVDMENGSLLQLPISPNGDPSYEGQPAANAHNGIWLPNGEMLFFAVDNQVYFPDGEYICEFRDAAQNIVSGNAEMCIVPDPRYCGDRYYIFMSNSASDQPFRFPYCAQVDMTYPSLSGYNDFGAPVNDGFDSNLNLSPPTEDSDNIYRLDDLVDFEDSFGNPTNFSVITNEGYAFAAAQLSDGESYLVLISSGSIIYRLLIDCEGMHPVNPIIPVDQIITQFGTQEGYDKSELELINLSNGNLRVGITYKSGSGQNRVVAAFDVNENGDYLTGTSVAHHLTEASPSDPVPIVKGLEFSESGRYLYFTHHQTTGNPDVVQYLDVDLETVHVLDVPSASDYEYSQIEMGTDGRLYFAHANGLATFNVPDNPGQFDPQNPTLTWNASFIQTTISQSNSGFPLDDSKYSYLLPDQIDGLDYGGIIDYPHTVYIADVSETWTAQNNPFITVDGVVRISEELRITSGTTINIQDMLFEFGEDARVVIEPGAQLNLDQTIFTIGPGCCEDNLMWLGVEVWGDPASPQTFASQGFFTMDQSGIEHAYIGVLLGSRNGEYESPSDIGEYDDYYSKFGGVVRAVDSDFANNERDALIANYIWLTGSGNETANYSAFDNCDFRTWSLLNYPEVKPLSHVELHKVRGVRMTDCSFRNFASFGALPINDRGIGINSYRSTFRVTGSNEPFTGDEEGSFQSFYKLRIGVLVDGYENHHFTVSNMEFQLNQYGMDVFGVSKETITFNNFEVPILDNDYPSGGYGAYLQNTYWFTVEENNFFSDEVSANTGLIVDNSNKDAAFTHLEVDNEVYRNTFSKLNLGIGVLNNNRGPRSNVGLQTRCNIFSEAGRADIYLGPESEWRDDQGSQLAVELLTNNIFSYPTYASSFPYRDVMVHEDYGINSGTPNLTFQYWCLEQPITEPVFDIANPQPIGQSHMDVAHNPQYSSTYLDYENHCPSNFSPTGGGLRTLAELQQTQITAENNLESALAVYQATIDGGETEDIIDLLENLLNEESAYLRDLLMERYPLSRDALMAAIDAAESFDPWHLTQVLVANSRLPVDVYQFLKDNEVLAPFFMQFVDDAQQNGGANLGLLLYAEVSHRSYEKSHTERDIHRHFLYHTDSVDYNAWNNYLQNREEPHYIVHRIGSHLDKAETGAAQSLLDSLNIHQDRKDWVQFMIDMEVADTVTATDHATAWDFFYNKPNTHGDAWGWLLANGLTDSIPPQPVVAEPRSFSLFNNDEQKTTERWLEAWPNPAKDRVVLTYPREADGIGTVQVFGPKGEFIREFAASDVGFQEINVTGWSPGLYIAKLIVNGKTFDTVKISVVR